MAPDVRHGRLLGTHVVTVLPEANWYEGQESIASKTFPMPLDSFAALPLYSSSETSELLPV